MYNNKTNKKVFYLFVVFIIFILISGCETISAFKTKDIRISEISQMLKMGILPTPEKTAKTTTETPDILKVQVINKVDTWIRNNLW